MKRSLLLGLLALLLTGCGTMGNLGVPSAMDVFSINNRQLDRAPPDPGERGRWRESWDHQFPCGSKPERIHGGII
ncbi:MAG TPA: hypothetical protein VM529_09050 [Gemmata sp.]|nr:hypothetical protein [Gemmata sp.]